MTTEYRSSRKPEPFARIWVDDSQTSAEVVSWFESEGIPHTIMPKSEKLLNNPYAPHPPAAQIVYGEEIGVLHSGPQDISNAVLNVLMRRRDQLIEELQIDLEIGDIEGLSY